MLAETNNLFAGDLLTSLWTVGTFAVLVLLLRRLAWRPILAALTRREHHIASSLESADQANRESRDHLAQAKDEVRRAGERARRIVDEATQAATAMREDVEATANFEVEQMRASAQREIRTARLLAAEEVYASVAEMSADVAARLLGRELTAQDHDRLIRQALADVEEALESEERDGKGP